MTFRTYSANDVKRTYDSPLLGNSWANSHELNMMLTHIKPSGTVGKEGRQIKMGNSSVSVVIEVGVHCAAWETRDFLFLQN